MELADFTGIAFKFTSSQINRQTIKQFIKFDIFKVSLLDFFLLVADHITYTAEFLLFFCDPIMCFYLHNYTIDHVSTECLYLSSITHPSDSLSRVASMPASSGI